VWTTKNLGQDIDGRSVALPISRRAFLPKRDRGFEIFRVLGMIPSTEIGLGQRVRRGWLQHFFRLGRLQGFFHGPAAIRHCRLFRRSSPCWRSTVVAATRDER